MHLVETFKPKVAAPVHPPLQSHLGVEVEILTTSKLTSRDNDKALGRDRRRLAVLSPTIERIISSTFFTIQPASDACC